MPTKDGFTPDHPLPLFLRENADELEQAGIEQAWDRAVISSRILKTSILVVTATVIAILWLGNPVALFANITASLVDISAWQPGTGQTPANQSTAGAEALPATARGAPTRDETAADADQSQTKISEPSAETLLKQFQAWAGEEDARAPVEPVRPAQDARAQDGYAQPVQDAPAQVQDAPARPIQKHRHVRRVQNARAEIRPERHPRTKVRREQNARVQVAPVQDPRAQDQSVQNAQAPSFLQSFGWRDQTQ
jgi:hypothetical protein